MGQKAVAWVILTVLLASVTGAYLLAWRARSSPLRRVASCIIAMLSSLAGLFGTVGYAIPAMQDVHTPGVPLTDAILVNLFLWTICVSAWVMAIRFALLALRKS
jgi:hypothetical protein